jgi:energy-coupling factor transport system permease protein
MSRFLFAVEEGDRPALALHPATVFTFCLCMIAVAFATVDIATYLVLLTALLVVMVVGKIPLASVARIVMVVVPLCFFITLIQTLSRAGPPLATFSLFGHTIALSRAGFMLGIAITLRVVTLAFTMTVFFSLVHPARMTQALYKAGIPFKYAYAFSLALRFLPIVIGELATINNAQKCRGYDIDRCNFVVKVYKIMPLMTPLIVTCLRRASTIALAMDLKAFGSIKQRTFFTELAGLRAVDKAVIGGSIAGSLGFIVISILG